MRVSRKVEHLQHALQIGQSGEHGLSDIRFVHQCLPEQSLSSVSLETYIGELNLSSPIVINAMTGGAAETEEINRELAIAARETGIAMAVGSQMSALRHPEVRSSYTIVREMNPTGIVFGNLGSEATVDQAQQAVEMLQANALQIHLNPMQELIMPEGDRDFRGVLDRIARIVQAVSVPVIVKEVGFGITGEAARRLREIGVSIVDVGGFGGTNFAAIENERREESLAWLNDWGIPTSCSLLDVQKSCAPAHIMASGGIRNALDICKALAIGAGAAGLAGLFLKTLKTQGTSAVIQQINTMHAHIKLIMTGVGAATIEELWRVPFIIGGETAHWCYARGIDITEFAQRK
jgi:isopentenyl-diphosphate delta-isomerase